MSGQSTYTKSYRSYPMLPFDINDRPRSHSSPQASMYIQDQIPNNPQTMPNVTSPMPPYDRQQFNIQMLPTNPTAPMYNHWNNPPRERTRKDRACDLCRRKKIRYTESTEPSLFFINQNICKGCLLSRIHVDRCNYNQLDPDKPCTSCENYKKMCTFNEAGKKRGPPKGYVEKLESRLKRMEDLLMNMAENGDESSDSIKSLLKGKGAQSQDTEQASSDESDQDTSSDAQADNKRKNSEEYGENEDRWRKRRDVSYSPSQDSQPFSQQSTSPLQKSVVPSGHYDTQTSPCSTDSDMPTYKQAFMGSSSGVYLLGKVFEMTGRDPKELYRESLNSLENHKDDLMVSIVDTGLLKEDFAFPHGNNFVPWKLPPKEVIDHLLHIYFTKMNIIIPIVDEDTFYDTYRNNPDSICMVLLASLCRSASRIMDENTPSARKHHITRTYLYESLTSQIKEKFELDLMEPKIETIQILLLGACNSTKWGADGVDWIAMSMAIKLAQELGLHRSRSVDGATKETIAFYKRLWWSSYIIDRWICASLGRPLMISDADCDIDLPEIEPDTQEPLASSKYAVFYHLVKLSGILGDILRTLCSPRARLMNHNEEIYNQSRINIEGMLEKWEQTLPSSLRITENEFEMIRKKEITEELMEKLDAGSGQLYLAYCTVHLQAKRPFLLPEAGIKKNKGMLDSCMEYMEKSIAIMDGINVETFIQFGWAISSFSLAQVYTFVLFSHQNDDKKNAELTNRQSYVLMYMYKRLEAYITEPSIIPVFELLYKTLNESSTTETNPNSNMLHAFHG
ncbi:fungal-specific transcription factor domain-containing protein [Phycomyces nitens]|nr:fungal-specific transcription factor domain-containing protein [Phycomyces nitens]